MLIEDIGANGSVAELFDQHHLPLIRLAIQLVDSPADAEHVVRDVFAALDPDRIVGSAGDHLTRAVLRRCRSTRRTRRAGRLFRRASPRPQGVERRHAGVPSSARADGIRARVDALPTRQREVLALRYCADRSVEETADLLGTTPDAVRSSASSALGTVRMTTPVDPAVVAADDPETELRAALGERADAVTSTILLRPEPDVPQDVRTRGSVTRRRIVGAAVVVGVVASAIVVGRGVVAPQQSQLDAEQGESTPAVAASPLDPDVVGGRLWGATSLSTSGDAFADPEWERVGARTMTVEFSAGGGVVFRDGRTEVRGQFVIEAGGLTITGATGWAAPVSRPSRYFEQSTALGGLLAGMPAPVRIDAAVLGEELVLSRGDTEIRYVVSGVTPAVAPRAGSATYPVAGVIGETWVASRIFTGTDDRLVPQSLRTNFTLAPAGTIVVRQGTVAASGRWWATSTGLMTIGVPPLTARSEEDPSGDGGDGAGVQYSVLAALQAMISGRASITVSTDGTRMRVTPEDGPRIPVVFVRG